MTRRDDRRLARTAGPGDRRRRGDRARAARAAVRRRRRGPVGRPAATAVGRRRPASSTSSPTSPSPTSRRSQRFRPRYVFHLAATFERSVESPEFWEQNWNDNVVVTHRLAELARPRAGSKSFVFASSYLVYDPAQYFDRDRRRPRRSPWPRIPAWARATCAGPRSSTGRPSSRSCATSRRRRSGRSLPGSSASTAAARATSSRAGSAPPCAGEADRRLPPGEPFRLRLQRRRGGRPAADGRVARARRACINLGSGTGPTRRGRHRRRRARDGRASARHGPRSRRAVRGELRGRRAAAGDARLDAADDARGRRRVAGRARAGRAARRGDGCRRSMTRRSCRPLRRPALTSEGEAPYAIVVDPVWGYRRLDPLPVDSESSTGSTRATIATCSTGRARPGPRPAHRRRDRTPTIEREWQAATLHADVLAALDEGVAEGLPRRVARYRLRHRRAASFAGAAAAGRRSGRSRRAAIAEVGRAAGLQIEAATATELHRPLARRGCAPVRRDRPAERPRAHPRPGRAADRGGRGARCLAACSSCACRTTSTRSRSWPAARARGRTLVGRRPGPRQLFRPRLDRAR